jgi:two-component system LytT family response regulator
MYPSNFFVLFQGKLLKINVSQVILIEGGNTYSTIITQTGKYTSNLTLGNIEHMLKDDLFCRVHRSYVIPLFRVEYVCTDIVNLGDRDVPIGRAYHQHLLDQLRVMHMYKTSPKK